MNNFLGMLGIDSVALVGRFQQQSSRHSWTVGAVYMTKEQIRAAVVRTIARIVSDEVLSNPKRDISIREQMKSDSTDSLELILGLRKRHAVAVPEDDYRQLAPSDTGIACLGPGAQGL